MGENPFLEDDDKEEEPYVIHKPYKKETITEAQKRRNLKGIDMVQETLKKIVPRRVL